MQNFINLPVEITEQKRFFPVNEKKIPLIKEWSNPDNQKHYQDVKGLAGFDISGHGINDDYLVLDFDHVLTDTGEWVNDYAKATFDWIMQSVNTFTELSISKHGLHIVLKPTANKFPTIVNSTKNTLYFVEGSTDEKLEIFYKTGGRYFLFTGDNYLCDPQTTIASGVIADNFIELLLKKISNSKKKPSPKTGTETSKTKTQTENANENAKTVSAKHYTTDPDFEKAKIEKALDFLDPSYLSYDDWLNIGKALKSESDSYLTLWDSWSSRDIEKYNKDRDNECAYKWGSFKGSGITIATLFKLAKDAGFDDKQFYKEWQKTHKNAQNFKSVEIAQVETNKQNILKDRRSLSKKERELLFNDLTADLDNAQKIIEMYKDKIRFITDLDRWALFEKPIWNIAKTPKNSIIYPLVNDLYKIMKLNAVTADDEKTAAIFKSKKKVADGVELCKAFPEILIKSKNFNQNPMLLNCPNGIVDLETGKLHPHDSNLLFTQCTGVEYVPDYNSKTVEDFLHSVLPDKDVLSALLIYLGYCLTGIVREDKALFIHGSGRNGKGTLLNALIRCFGDFGVTLRNSILLKNRNFDNGENATPELAKLEYKRIAILDEIPAGRTLDESKFKNLTGGDHFSVRKLHQEPIDIDPTHKFILSGNFLPEIKDARDIAISERLLVIKFEQSFIGEKCDPTVRENMKKPEALTGLLSTIVGACLKWQELGRIFEPEAVKNFKQEYLDENDVIGEFIESNCKFSVDLAIPCQNFIKHFRSISNGASMSDRAIIAAVAKIEGIKKHKMKYGQTFQGIGWIDTDLYTS